MPLQSSAFSFGSRFQAISKTHSSKIVRIRRLYKDVPGHWHRNGMVKFASGSLMGKARNLLLLVVVPCHTLHFKHLLN